jgi:hypothetical protein
MNRWDWSLSFCTHRTHGISQIFIHACFVVGRKKLCRQYHTTKVCGSLHLIQPLPLLKFLHAPRLCLWSHGADNQNFTQPLRQKHDLHCILNYIIINGFTIAKKSREKKNPIALNYYCQKQDVDQIDIFDFQRTASVCPASVFCQSDWPWFILLINTLAMQQHFTTETMLCSRQQNWSTWHLHTIAKWNSRSPSNNRPQHNLH